MKIHIEIVTGFLGTGKTSFINALISESQVSGEKVVIFQLEEGINKIDNKNSLEVIRINQVKDIKEKLMFSINEQNPNRIIIEYNGTNDLRDLFNITNEEYIKKYFKVTTIFFVADIRNLEQYIDNIGNFIIPFIQHADMVIINNIDYSSKATLADGIKKVKQINPKAYILNVKNKYLLKSALRESKVIDNGYLKKLKIQISNYKRHLLRMYI